MERSYRCAYVTVNCETCGKDFHPFFQNRTTARFCSRACRHATAAPPEDKYRCKAITLRCQTCRAKFHPHYTNKTAKFCSAACAGKPKASVALKMPKAETAWLAGLFDGEGCIAFPSGTNKLHSIRVQISNTNYELLQAVQTRTGTGKLIRQMHSGVKAWKPHYKDSWAWQCYGENARSLLKQMFPWLIEKKPKALLVLDG